MIRSKLTLDQLAPRADGSDTCCAVIETPRGCQNNHKKEGLIPFEWDPPMEGQFLVAV